MVDINVTIDEPEEINVSLDAGVATFLALTDTPTSYSGQTGKVATVNSGETALELTTPTVGDVVGPSSAGDNAIATFDTTNGKLIQDSGLIAESNKLYQSGYPNSYIKFNNGQIEIWAGGVKQAQWS